MNTVGGNSTTHLTQLEVVSTNIQFSPHAEVSAWAEICKSMH